MTNFSIFTKLLIKLGHTILPICDCHLITIDHRIPIDCNTLLQPSSSDAATIKKVIKTFSLACNLSIGLPAKAQVNNLLWLNVVCLFRGLQISWIFGTSNLFHWKLVEILCDVDCRLKRKLIIFLTCRYHTWRFPNNYSHIATTQCLAIVSIALRIAWPIYLSATSAVLSG